MTDADSRHFRTIGQLVCFNLARSAVEDAVVGAWFGAHGVKPDPLPQLETAVETMLLVSQAIRPARHGCLRERGARLPGTSGEALELGAGLCGHQTQVFATLARSLGLDVRQVGFAFQTERGDETHAAVEVVIGGRWCFFDITWCCYWTDGTGVLSVDDVVSLEDRTVGLVVNQPAFATSAYALGGRDPFVYLDGARTLLTFTDTVLA